MEESNREFAKTNVKFLEACGKAQVDPTKRQASKYRRKIGRAWKGGR